MQSISVFLNTTNDLRERGVLGGGGGFLPPPPPPQSANSREKAHREQLTGINIKSINTDTKSIFTLHKLNLVFRQ